MTRVWIGLALVVASLLYLVKVVGFWRVMPGHDFVGDLVYAEMLAESLKRGVVFPDWIATEALGRPSTVQRSSALLFLPVATLVVAGLSVVTAAKAWMVALHTASFASAYALGRTVRLPAHAALIAACAYGLSRLHLESFVVRGHWQLAVSFFLSPLLAAQVIAVGRTPARGRVAGLALLFAWSLLADNERTVTLAPVLVLLGTWTAISSAGPLAGLTAVAGASALGVTIALAGAGPLFLEREMLALAREPSLFDAHAAVRFSHPLYVIDGGAWLTAAGEPRPEGAGGVRESFLLVLGGVAACLVALAIRGRHAAPSLSRVSPMWGGALVLVLWLGTSTPPWARSTFSLLPASPTKSAAVGALISVAAIAVVATLMWRASLAGRVALAALVTTLAFVSARSLLSGLPVFSAIANTRWFLQVNLPLVSSVLVGALAAALLGDAGEGARSWTALVRGAGGVALAALLALDVLTNPRPQSTLSPSVEDHARAVAAATADATFGRTLPVPYVESNADEAYAARFATRPSASSWLLWSGSRWGVGRVARLHARLAAEPASGLRDAAALDVRYLIASPAARVWLAPLVDAGLVAALPSACGCLFQNLLHDGDRFATAAAAPIAYERPRAERIVVPAAPPGTVRFAESYYPWWRASLDGRALAVREEDGLIAVDVPSGGRVELRFERPNTDRGFAVASLAGLLGAALLAISSIKRARSRPRPA